MASCQFCGNELTGKQEKFCSRRCKDQWWNEKRKAEMKGFKIMADALEEAGFEVRPLPADQGESRVK